VIFFFLIHEDMNIFKPVARTHLGDSGMSSHYIIYIFPFFLKSTYSRIIIFFFPHQAKSQIFFLKSYGVGLLCTLPRFFYFFIIIIITLLFLFFSYSSSTYRSFFFFFFSSSLRCQIYYLYIFFFFFFFLLPRLK
jgi:hypothetical protein